MAYLDMYGRRADQEATFYYPSTQLPLKRAGKLYIKLPAAANPIFGVPQSRNRNADQTVVQLDPTSTYEYRSFNPSDDTPPAIGLGGFGRKKRRLSGLGGVKTNAEKIQEANERKKAFDDRHPNLVRAAPGFVDWLISSPIAMGGLMLTSLIALMTISSTIKRVVPGN